MRKRSSTRKGIKIVLLTEKRCHSFDKYLLKLNCTSNNLNGNFSKFKADIVMNPLVEHESIQ